MARVELASVWQCVGYDGVQQVGGKHPGRVSGCFRPRDANRWGYVHTLNFPTYEVRYRDLAAACEFDNVRAMLAAGADLKLVSISHNGPAPGRLIERVGGILTPMAAVRIATLLGVTVERWQAIGRDLVNGNLWAEDRYVLDTGPDLTPAAELDEPEPLPLFSALPTLGGTIRNDTIRMKRDETTNRAAAAEPRALGPRSAENLEREAGGCPAGCLSLLESGKTTQAREAFVSAIEFELGQASAENRGHWQTMFNGCLRKPVSAEPGGRTRSATRAEVHERVRQVLEKAAEIGADARIRAGTDRPIGDARAVFYMWAKGKGIIIGRTSRVRS